VFDAFALSDRTWAIVVMVAFPLLFIAIGELAERYAGNHAPIAHALRALRNLVLPLLVAIITVRFIVHGERSTLGFRLVETAFWVAAVFVGISFINAVLFEETDTQSWRAHVPTFVRHMSRTVLVLIGVAIIVSRVWGADLKGALTALGVGSIVLGLALQGTLAGIVSGIALLIDKPFRENDVVKIGEISGTVREMNWRSVRIQSNAHDLVIIPNSKIAEQSVINLTRPQAWHIETYEFRFAFEDSPTAVKDMLLNTAKSCTNAMRHPAPSVALIGYGEYAIRYELRAAVTVDRTSAMRDELLTRVWYAGQRYGFRMPFPISTSIETNALESQRMLREQELAEAREVLSSALSLDARTVEALVQQSPRKIYGPSETILEQGDVVRSLAIIVSGKGTLGHPTKDGKWVEVGQLSRGDIFGASSVLGGEPSQLSFRALTELCVLELPKKDVFEIIKEHQRFATELQRLIAQRRKLLAEHKPAAQA